MARASRKDEQVTGPALDAQDSPGSEMPREQQRAEAVAEVRKEEKSGPDFAQIAEDSGRTEGQVRAQYEMNNAGKMWAEGKPPKTGAEGGVIEDGTGDFDPDTGSVIDLDRESRRATPPQEKVVEEPEAPEGFMVVFDSNGMPTLDEIGVDGENPVSTQNPPPKAIRK